MQIRRYTMGMIAFVVLLGWYTFAFITQESATIDLFFIELSLPIAFWVIVPVFVFYVASMLHMLYHWIALRLKLRHYTKDFEKLTDAINDALMGKQNRNNTYQTERYQLIGKIIDNVTMQPLESYAPVGQEKIDKTVSNVLAINSGETAELKRNLDKNNPIVIKNQINQLDKGMLKPKTVFEYPENYSEAVCSKAFDCAVPDMPIYELEKYKRYMSRESLFDIMGRIGDDLNKQEVETASIIALINEHDLTEQEYLGLARTFSKSILPDQRLKVFETLYDNNDKATAAYLYTLFDLEMISLADEVLAQSRDNECIAYRAYRDLKAMNKHYPIDIFI